MFLIDKYKPNNIDDFICHKNILKQLEIISKDVCIPNIIFYGPVHVGKKSIVKIFLELIFDKSIHKMTKTKYTIVNNTGVSSEIEILQSNYHILIEPSNNNSDKYVIQDIIKEYVSKTHLNFFKTKKLFKIILINDVHNLSYHAQTSLRRTMELYAKTCRFILISSSLTKIIEPLRSRCFMIRIPIPKMDEIYRLIINIASNEKIELKLSNLIEMRKKCGQDIHKCIWYLEYLKSNCLDNLLYLDSKYDHLCNLILKTNITLLNEIRDIIYYLIITNINATEIIKSILKTILKKISNNYHKYLIIKSASLYESRSITSRHVIMHIEGFIINIYTILQF